MRNIFLHIVFILAALTAALPAYGQPEQSGDPPTPQRKKVGVVLSGGGAKGVAHISALKAIEDAGIPIDIITGTSMGALVGGLYSIGYSTQALDSMVRAQDWSSLLSDRVSRRHLSFLEKDSRERDLITVPLTTRKGIAIPSGITGGHNVYNMLTELTIGYHDSMDFRHLPIPFACVAFDMVKGESVTFTSGYLPLAMRASMSIPGAFTPIRHNGMVLVDGSIENNFPVDVARSMGAEIVIGIDLSAELKKEDELNSVTDIVDQLTNITAAPARARNIRATDLYIHPNIDGFSAASFSAAAVDTLLNRGKEAMDANYGKLIALKEKIGIPANCHAETHQDLELNRPIAIDSIRFEGLDNYEERNIRKLLDFPRGGTVTSAQLHQAMANLQGSGLFSDVSYRLDGASPYDLIFTCEESKHNSLSLGFRFDTEEMAALLLHAAVTPENFGNTYLFAAARLSSNPYVQAGIAAGNEINHKFFLSYTYRYNDVDLYHEGVKSRNMDYRQHIADIHFANIRLRNFKVETGIRYEYFHYESQLLSPDMAHDIAPSEGLVELYIRPLFESLNSRYYPTRGISFQTDYTLYSSDFFTYRGHAPVSAITGDFFAPLSISRRITVTPGVFTRVLIGERDYIPYTSRNFVGGVMPGRYIRQQIPFYGIHDVELFDNALLGVKADVRVGLWEKIYGSLKFNYMKHSDDFFDLAHGQDVFGTALCFSYDSFIGPIDLMADWSNRDKEFGVYLNMGYYF